MVLKPAVRIILVTLVIFITACPNQGGGGGENGAIDEAHVSGGVTADDDSGEKLELPRKVTRAMDFPASYTLEEVVEARTGVHIMYTLPISKPGDTRPAIIPAEFLKAWTSAAANSCAFISRLQRTTNAAPL